MRRCAGSPPRGWARALVLGARRLRRGHLRRIRGPVLVGRRGHEPALVRPVVDVGPVGGVALKPPLLAGLFPRLLVRKVRPQRREIGLWVERQRLDRELHLPAILRLDEDVRNLPRLLVR